MGRLFFCGGELGSGTDYETFGGMAGSMTITSTNRRSGGYCYRSAPTTTGSGSAWFGKFLSTTGVRAALAINTAYFRTYFRAATLPASASEEILAISDSSSARKFGLRINTAGQLLSYNSDGTTLIGTSVATVLLNVYHRIEVMISGATTFEVKLDGEVILSGTVTNGNPIGYFQVGKVVNRNGQTVSFNYDDIAIDDSEYPGEGQVLSISPTGNGTDVFTGAGLPGGDWSSLDEIPVSTGDARAIPFTSAESPQSETFVMENYTTLGKLGDLSIKAVVSWAICNRSGATALTVKSRARSGGSVSEVSTGFSVTGTYVGLSHFMAVDPSGAAWTTSRIDNLECGYSGILSSGSETLQCAGVHAMIELVPGVGGGPGDELVVPNMQYRPEKTWFRSL